MSVHFCDSSALVKRYVTEIGTAWLTATLDPNIGSRIYIAQITIVEVVSAITRRERGGHTTANDAIKALTRFENDWRKEITTVELSAVLVDDAVALARKYALRGYDAVQLATILEVHNERTALGLSSLPLLSADTDLNAAALSEGLTVDNPNNHP